MAIVTAQQILDYYDRYRAVEVTFTREVIQATGLIANQNLLKCVGEFWPCVPYSASMSGAKVIANLNARYFEAMRNSNKHLSLRLCFRLPDKPDPLSLFITARAAGHTRYSQDNPDVYFLSLAYSQKPPDDFIYIIGRLLDANLNASKRKEERIVVTAESARGLGLKPKETKLVVGTEARACIIRDISFSGAKLLTVGASAALVGQPARLAVTFDDEEAAFVIVGTVLRFEAVQGRTDIGALAIRFDEAHVPLRYKVRINAYLKRIRLADAAGADAPPEAPLRAPSEASPEVSPEDDDEG